MPVPGPSATRENRVKRKERANTRRREIIHHQRDGVGIASRVVNLGSIRLDPPGVAIDVAEIYAGLG